MSEVVDMWNIVQEAKLTGEYTETNLEGVVDYAIKFNNFLNFLTNIQDRGGRVYIEEAMFIRFCELVTVQYALAMTFAVEQAKAAGVDTKIPIDASSTNLPVEFTPFKSNQNDENIKTKTEDLH